MPTSKQKMVLLIMLSISAATLAYAQVGSEHLQELMELSARRLVIAERVALAKWDNGMPVEDASRENQVIGSAMRAGQSRGFNVGVKLLQSADRADKLVQYALLAEWCREGGAPDQLLIDPFLSDNLSGDNGRSGCLTGKNSTRG